MTCTEFRNALVKLRFLELPASINLADYYFDIKKAWRINATIAFFRLSDADQEKVWAAISAVPERTGKAMATAVESNEGYRRAMQDAGRGRLLK